MAGDVVQELGGPEDRVRIRRRALRVQAVPLQLPGEQLLEGVSGGLGGLPVLEVAEERDPDRAVVEVTGVAASNDVAGQILAVVVLAGPVVAREPALVDPARFVDQEVVADVAEVAADGLEVVDRPDGRGRVRVVVPAGRVVDDRLLHRRELGAARSRGRRSRSGATRPHPTGSASRSSAPSSRRGRCGPRSRRTLGPPGRRSRSRSHGRAIGRW